MLLAYIGPDTLLPMTSVIAAVLGCAAMFGRGFLVIAARVLRAVARIPGRKARGVFRSSGRAPSRLVRDDLGRERWRGLVKVADADRAKDTAR